MRAQADSLLKAAGKRKTRAVSWILVSSYLRGSYRPGSNSAFCSGNIGNGHTLGALVNENRIMAILSTIVSL